MRAFLAPLGKWRTPAKPWLLIDVDGVIIPLGHGAQTWARNHRAATAIWWDDEAEAEDAPDVTIIPIEPGMGLQRARLMQAIAALGTREAINA